MPLACGFGTSLPRAPAQTGRPTTAPAAPGVQPFQPGVGIHWNQPAVYVDGHVVLREGPIEFLACFAGKEHESIVRLDASATHIYMALGLIGLKSGHPPRWQEREGRFGPPAGDPIDVTIEWREGDRPRSVAGFDWIREFEYGRTPIDRPWVFAGSRRLADGTLSADHSGEGLAVVDKPDSLLALSRSHVSRDAELWAEAHTAAIAALSTPVRIVLRPAGRRTYRIGVDFRGAPVVDGRYAHAEDLADLIGLARLLSPDRVQEIRLVGTLQSDAGRLRQVLAAAGVPDDAWRFVRRDPPAAPPRRPTP